MANDEYEDNKHIHAALAPLMEALGWVAHHWAKLEYEVNQMIWALAGMRPGEGACITSQIPSIVPRMRALSALAHGLGASSDLLSGLNKFSNKADKVARRRARALHDPWYYREQPDEHFIRIEYGRLEITADRQLVYEIKPQSRKEVLEIAHECIALISEFRELRTRLISELKEPLESRLGKSLEEVLDCPSPDSAT